MMELDPVIVRALKLIHSRSSEALEQLKQITDEAISLRRGELALKKFEDDGQHPEIRTLYKSGISRPQSELDKKRESEKRSFEKLKEDLIFLNEDETQTKKLKLDPDGKAKDKDRSKERRDDKRPTLKEDPSWLDISMPKKPPGSSSERRFTLGGGIIKADNSESSEDDTPSQARLDADQFADMMDLACVVCKQMDITSSNRLLDCQECHRLYHQDCHKPAVNEDVDDPRFVWYCSKCSKNMKKMVKAQKPKSTSSSSSKEKESSREQSKSFSQQPATQTPFRRMDATKSSGSSKEGSSRPYTGLASLAANLSKPADSSKSRSSESTKIDKSKVDHSKGLGFLFKPDAHKITNLNEKKSSIMEKASAYKVSSGKSSFGKSLTSKITTQPIQSKPVTSSGGKSAQSLSRSSSSNSVKSMTSSSSSSSVTGSSKSMTSSTMMTADKKLQMMKKKAAAKAADRKTYR